MRVTFQYQALRYQEVLRNSLSDMMAAQDKSNAKRLNYNPSDNPSGYVAAYNYQRAIDTVTQYKKNAESADGWLSENDSNIQGVIDALQEIRDNIALNGNNDTNNAESLKALAGSVLQAYQQIFDVANTKYNGRYIFAGQQTDDVPFVDQVNTVSSIYQASGKGGDVSARSVFTDMSELKSGNYIVQVERDPVDPTIGKLSVTDRSGNKMILDTNGSDDTLNGGNQSSTELVFKIKPGEVINTGRGISVTIPEDLSVGNTLLKYEFKYEAGSNATYYGDMGALLAQIGYNQDVQYNISGQDLFLETAKILRASQYNSANGVSITPSTRFSQMDRTNAGVGDSITVSGTDHNGLPVGVAKVTAPENIKFDMTNASQKERTLTLGYAGNYYQIEVPARGYKDAKDLSETINRLLTNAQYVGAQSIPPVLPMSGQTEYNAYQNTEINALNVTYSDNRNVDISGQINVSTDGGRLTFVTTDVGDQTALSVTGYKHNLMGFDDKTVGAMGKDITFELGNDFKSSGINILSTTHESVDFANKPTMFVVNGETIALDINITTATTTLDLELSINKALQRAGFGYTVTSKVEDRNPANPLSTRFDVTFTMQNVNVDRNTHLSTAYQDTTRDIHDYKMATPEKDIDIVETEKTLNDYMNFIKTLYDDAVEVSLENGRINVQDLRTGESRLSINMNENNEGIGLPAIDNNIIVGGRYNSSTDNKWDVSLSMSEEADGSKTVNVLVKDQLGATIVDRTITNYMGEEISLRSGVTIVADDMLSNGQPSPQATRFILDLRGDASLNFGDMNIYDDGKNANVFKSLMNLYDALNNGVTIDPAPSAWASESYQSSAIPYFDGEFGGNSNSKWQYIVESADGRTEFYIQDEFDSTINFPQFDANKTSATFEVELYDSKTQQFLSIPLTVDISGAQTQGDVTNAILDAVNENADLHQRGVRAAINDNGELAIYSGSGTQTVSVKDFTMKSPLPATLPEASAITFDYQDPAGVWHSETFNLTAGMSAQDILDEINAQTGTTGVTAALDADGALTFTGTRAFEYTTLGDDLGLMKAMRETQGHALGVLSADTTLELEYFDGTNWHTTNIGLSKDDTPADVVAAINNKVNPNITAALDVDGNLTFTSAYQVRYDVITGSDLGLVEAIPESVGDTIASPSLSGLNEEQRTLNFKFNDYTGDRNISITLDAVDYDSVEDMVDAVNDKLASAGLDQFFTAAVDEDGRLGFNSTHVRDFVVEGDHKGSLGFKRTGDNVNIKVQDEKGRTIQNMFVDTANTEFEVSDGILLGFDTGSMFATDSFTGTVGSQVEYELGVLDQVERQLLEALTSTGTRQARTESVIAFSDVVIENNTTQMARATGSTEFDQIQMMTDLELAKQAYQAALAMVTSVMSMSILDYM